MVSNGSSIYEVRLNEIRSRVNSRLSEISQRTGVRFSEFMERSTTESTVAATSNTNVSAELLKQDLLQDAENKQISDLLTQIQTATAAQKTQSGVYTNGSPLSLSGIIESVAASYGIDAGLVAAIARAGSNFDPSFVSSAGAIGVMQIMSATAVGLGVSDPYDPEQNIDGGARYLKGQLERYNGDLLMALAAYSAGSGTLKNREITDLNDPEQFLRLPKETQEFLRNVMDYYSTFNALG